MVFRSKGQMVKVTGSQSVKTYFRRSIGCREFAPLSASHLVNIMFIAVVVSIVIVVNVCFCP